MSDIISEFRTERAKLNERLLSPENDASIIKRVFALDTYAYSNKNLGLAPKQKEMLGLISSMVLRCDDCIKYHLEKCFELGVSNDEMMDVFGIANVVGGTIVIPHTRRAIEYWEALITQRPEPNPFSKSTKEANYEVIIKSLDSLLRGINNEISIMATINETLKNQIPYYYWVGFYLVENNKLVVGPYQGTHGCLYIDFGKGVCGRAAESKKTIIVKDIELLNTEQKSINGNLHISCDPRCKSEIVVPVTNKAEKLIAVFDVDSLSKNAFDEIDQKYLELILVKYFKE